MSDNFVYGTVRWKESKSIAQKTGDISVWTEYGCVKEKATTDNNGKYKIKVAGDFITDIYYKGNKVWHGRERAKGGVEIDLYVPWVLI